MLEGDYWKSVGGESGDAFTPSPVRTRPSVKGEGSIWQSAEGEKRPGTKRVAISEPAAGRDDELDRSDVGGSERRVRAVASLARAIERKDTSVLKLALDAARDAEVGG